MTYVTFDQTYPYTAATFHRGTSAGALGLDDRHARRGRARPVFLSLETGHSFRWDTIKRLAKVHLHEILQAEASV